MDRKAKGKPVWAPNGLKEAAAYREGQDALVDIAKESFLNLPQPAARGSCCAITLSLGQRRELRDCLLGEHSAEGRCVRNSEPDQGFATTSIQEMRKSIRSGFALYRR